MEKEKSTTAENIKAVGKVIGKGVLYTLAGIGTIVTALVTVVAVMNNSDSNRHNH
jgi:tetrahydromethanopterin S-methyltransferase subunit G